jgi:hypothetical protein
LSACFPKRVGQKEVAQKLPVHLRGGWRSNHGRVSHPWDKGCLGGRDFQETTVYDKTHPLSLSEFVGQRDSGTGRSPPLTEREAGFCRGGRCFWSHAKTPRRKGREGGEGRGESRSRVRGPPARMTSVLVIAGAALVGTSLVLSLTRRRAVAERGPGRESQGPMRIWTVLLL